MVVILCWQLSLQVGVVLLVARRCLCLACEIGLSSSSWLNQKWRFSEAGWLSFSLRKRSDSGSQGQSLVRVIVGLGML